MKKLLSLLFVSIFIIGCTSTSDFEERDAMMQSNCPPTDEECNGPVDIYEVEVHP
jgi:hypothetical protein